jgi:hypothetical protein
MMRIYKEPSELSQYEKMRGDFKLLWPKVKQAFAEQVWLYNKLSGEWFTPEEFLAAYQKTELNNYEIGQLQQNIILRDPKQGNAAYHKAINAKIETHNKEISELRERGESFLNKVIEYYQHLDQGNKHR